MPLTPGVTHLWPPHTPPETHAIVGRCAVHAGHASFLTGSAFPYEGCYLRTPSITRCGCVRACMQRSGDGTQPYGNRRKTQLLWGASTAASMAQLHMFQPHGPAWVHARRQAVTCLRAKPAPVLLPCPSGSRPGCCRMWRTPTPGWARGCALASASRRPAPAAASTPRPRHRIAAATRESTSSRCL